MPSRFTRNEHHRHSDFPGDVVNQMTWSTIKPDISGYQIMLDDRSPSEIVTQARRPQNPQLRAVSTAVLLLPSQPALAQQAVRTGPANRNWFTAAKWSMEQVPGATTAVAVKSGGPVISGNGALAGSLSIGGPTVMTVVNTNLSGLGSVTVRGAGPAAGAHTLTSLYLSGTSSAGGITINAGGSELSPYSDASVNFYNTSSASTATLNGARGVPFGFEDTSSAAQAVITNNGSLTGFQGSPSAGTAHITNDASGELRRCDRRLLSVAHR
jgi:hypothetical protein